jgi:hypothetical protein
VGQVVEVVDIMVVLPVVDVTLLMVAVVLGM